MVKIIVNHRHQPGCHHSEPHPARSKESNNQGIKQQVKRTFKSYFFCHEKKRDRRCLKFSWTLSTSAQQVPQPPFQNQCPLILLLSLFQPPGQDQQNGKHCHLLPQSFRITLKDTSSNISFFDLSTNFKFVLKHVYPTMGVKNIQIYGV